MCLLCVYIQNFSWYEADAFYDVEYFETDDNTLFGQYNLQRVVPVVIDGEAFIYPEGVTKTVGDIEYLIYQYDNFFEVIIIDDKSHFSIVFKDFNEMLELDEAEFTEIALQQYELIQNAAKNSRGISRHLSEEF